MELLTFIAWATGWLMLYLLVVRFVGWVVK